MNNSHYLEEGYLTKPTPLLVNISNDFDGEGVQLLNNIFLKVKYLLKVSAENYFSSDEFEKKLNLEHLRRSAEEVVKSDYHYGCDEYGIVFATLARIKGVPTKYIQCVDLISYKEGVEDVDGHVFLECYIDDKVYLIDSTKGDIVELKNKEDKQQLYVVNKQEKRKFFVEVYSGLDSWEAGIRTHKDFIQTMITVARKSITKEIIV